MKFHGFELNKSLSELRASPYHQQLGRKFCAAFIAQQHGTRLDTAHNKIEEPVGDLWLIMAEIARVGVLPENACDTAITPNTPVM
ncbi:MAG TPA: hypothetical protein VFA04_20355 [Bryobacteraceae bacterium]|nr:hypothetical protein [Bryobacteraceae bacterium]